MSRALDLVSPSCVAVVAVLVVIVVVVKSSCCICCSSRQPHDHVTGWGRVRMTIRCIFLKSFEPALNQSHDHVVWFWYFLFLPLHPTTCTCCYYGTNDRDNDDDDEKLSPPHTIIIKAKTIERTNGARDTTCLELREVFFFFSFLLFDKQFCYYRTTSTTTLTAPRFNTGANNNKWRRTRQGKEMTGEGRRL